MDTAAILIVDDDEDILTAGKLLLKRAYPLVETTSDPSRIPDLMAQRAYHAILLDMNFGPGASSGAEGFHWLERILAIDPDAVVVLITAHGGVELAVEAMKHGATDFVAKPWQNEKLLATLSAAVKLRASRFETGRLKDANRVLTEAAAPGGEPMLGSSEALAAVLRTIERAAPTDANVLLLGENGTGKELAARALHGQSLRSDGPFVTVDLGAVTESLFESELFGHVKGAFTDAKRDSIGRIQAAHGGTLFLDEVGNLPRHLQAKLLSALESREVTPVGGSRGVAVDVRVIAATNVPREDLAQEERFRQDLLFRLNTVEITLPPLRARRADIPELAEHYAALYARKYNRPALGFPEAVMNALCTYDWPGNVRALRHAVERAVILAEGEAFALRDFPLNDGYPTESAATSSAEADFEELNLENIERHAIQRALTRNRYNISHAARDLGLTRAALYRRMEKHGL
ncbi:MAG: sigma-54 dependent transcriptional regulator [Pseudomonadota bacterium]